MDIKLLETHTVWSLWRGLQTYYIVITLSEACTLDVKLLSLEITHTAVHCVEPGGMAVEGSAGAVSMQTDNRSIPRSPFLDGR